jgi:hypothetical protein
MGWDSALKPIRELLEEIYPSEKESRRMIEEAGMSASEISFGPTNRDTWHDILRKAKIKNRLPILFDVCITDSGSAKLKDACEAYLLTAEADLDRELSNIGEKSYITCDRIKQGADFVYYFQEHMRTRPGIPQVYIIPGDEGQRHNSLVERFHAVNIAIYVKDLPQYGAKKGAVPRWEIDFDVYEDLVESQKRLLFTLFEKCKQGFAIRNSDYSSSAFGELLKETLYPAIVIQHDINIAKWNKVGRELMELYFNFLNEIPGNESTPQIIVFLNVIYPARQRWLSLLDIRPRTWKKPLSQKYERQIQEIFQLQKRTTRWVRDTPPCVMLDNLGCVTRDDVLKWFRANNIGGGRLDWHKYTDRIVGENECKSMGEVEGALIEMLDRLRQQYEKSEMEKG